MNWNGRDTLLLLLLSVMGSLGLLCSNDTRTGLPQCTSCSSIRTCWSASDFFTCNPNLHTGYIFSNESSGKWLGQCWERDVDKNYTGLIYLNIPNENMTTSGLIINATMSSGCERCLNESCNGDLTYCNVAEIAWGGCDYQDSCYCELFEGYERLSVLTNDGYVPADPVSVCFGNLYQAGDQVFRSPQISYDNGPYGWEGRGSLDTVGKKRNIGKSVSALCSIHEMMFGDCVVSHEPEAKGSESLKRYQGISLTWDQSSRLVKVVTNQPHFTRLYLRKTGMEDSFPCDLTSNDFLLSEEWVKTTESIFYQIYLNISLVDSGIMATRKSAVCEIPDCIFCADVGSAWTCFPTSFRTMTVLFYLFFGACVVLILIIAWLVIRGSIAGYSANINLSVPTIGEAMKTTVVVLSIMSRLGFAGACDASFSIHSSGFVCTNHGSSRSCVMNELVQTDIPLPGFTICYDMIDTGTNIIQGRIIVTYIEMKTFATVDLDYWTSSYHIETESVKACPAHEKCTTGNDCNTARSGDDLKTQNGTLTGSEVELPGPRGCLSSCGCAGCGCFVCDESCIYYGVGFRPVEPTYKVLSVTGVSLKPTLKVCYVQVNETADCETVTVSTSSVIDVNPKLEVQYVGSLVGSVDVFGTNKFIFQADGSNVYYGTAAAASITVLNAVGDIQSATQGGLENPTRTSFIWHPEIVDAYDSGENSAAFTTNAPGAGLLSLYPKLPHQIGDTIWHADGNAGIVGLDESPGSLKVNIRATNVTFTQVVDQVCPVLKSHGITGSYLSDGGATWVIFGSSDCATGSCFLSVDTTTVQLTRSSMRLYADQTFTYIVNFTASLKEGRVKLTCTAGSNTASIEEKYSLGDPNTIINPNGTTPSVTPGTPTDGGGGVKFDLGKWLGFGIGSFAMIVVIIIAICIGVSFLRGGGYTKVENKFVSEQPVKDDEISLNGNETDEF